MKDANEPTGFMSEAEHIAQDEEIARFEERREAKLDMDETALLPPRRPGATVVERYRTSAQSPCCRGRMLKIAINTISGRLVLRCAGCGKEAGRGIRFPSNKEDHNEDQ